MMSVLEVEMDKLTAAPSDELGRILRYRAGNLKHYELVAGDHQEIYDSAYVDVGAVTDHLNS